MQPPSGGLWGRPPGPQRVRRATPRMWRRAGLRRPHGAIGSIPPTGSRRSRAGADTVGLDITETRVDGRSYESYVCWGRVMRTKCAGDAQAAPVCCSPSSPRLHLSTDRRRVVGGERCRKTRADGAGDREEAGRGARPIVFAPRAANCCDPQVKAFVTRAASVDGGRHCRHLRFNNRNENLSKYRASKSPTVIRGALPPALCRPANPADAIFLGDGGRQGGLSSQS